ncbi:hypothetical protein S7711_02837 [Stachybotrys chartarum IBT 7711]|uniref:SET domain-containing protein n=1 Tax=Stachybotrys chartarum (strain CBS 109288 / IBT 7711) TaxID=1280523 RepID=A0A084AH54_STACB|nr:hypothetical protein S7711_02837 [Stachybotrys chartarum IBT 7711]
MNALQKLIDKARDDGLEMMGIAPQTIPGRGVGVLAERDLDPGTVILAVPAQAVRSLHTVPKSITRKLDASMSVHGLLAADVALRRTAWTEWARLVPSWCELETAMPLTWPQGLRDMLPAEAKRLVAQQHVKFKKDWEMYKKGFPNSEQQVYLYAWLLVNTRGFYYETPALLRYPWHDRLALIPIADLFNHAAVGCLVEYSPDGYQIVTDRAYQAGEELRTSYGEHSNDFLLAEYGFTLKDNHWDGVCLDELVLSKLSSEHISALRKKGYQSDFMLHPGSVSQNNLWIALRLHYSGSGGPQWHQYVDGNEDAEGTLAKAKDMLAVLLREQLRHAEDTLIALQSMEIEQGTQRDILAQRWGQLVVMARQALDTQSLASNAIT